MIRSISFRTSLSKGIFKNNLIVGSSTYLSQLASYSYRKNIGGRSSSTLNRPALEQLTRTPFDGYNYSEQLWGNVDNLAERLKETLSAVSSEAITPERWPEIFVKILMCNVTAPKR